MEAKKKKLIPVQRAEFESHLTVFTDHSFHQALLPTMRHEAVFEIAIANASGN
jgi:hypothetical protein